MNNATVTVPNGLWFNGERHREAELKPLTGADEAFLTDAGRAFLPASWTTELLLRSLKRFGSINEIHGQMVRSLSIGDREALVLHLRRLTFGDTLDCVIDCPECAEKIDPDLKVNGLLVPAYGYLNDYHESVITQDDKAYRVRFRLPIGADQEEASTLARRDPGAAVDLILRNCLLSVTTEDGNCHGGIPAQVAHQLPGIMSDLDPQAEITINLSCPACGSKFSTIFDAAAYFFQELEAQAKLLYREIHLLAFNYHWSETDILDMSDAKRRMYLNFLHEAFMEAKRK